MIDKIFDVWYYIEGTFRYELYYSSYFKWMMRPHIKDQIDFRISVMNQRCFAWGSCVECGCKTTALQMCGKRCKGNCYPEMMTERVWRSVGPILARAFEKDRKLYKELVANT